MYNQKEYFSVINSNDSNKNLNKDFSIGKLNQAEDDEIDHKEETEELSVEELYITEEVIKKELIKKIINDDVLHGLKRPIIKKKVLTRTDFDDIKSVDEVKAAKELESEIDDETSKDTIKSITIILSGISFTLLVGLFLFFYYKKKSPSQMLH